MIPLLSEFEARLLDESTIKSDYLSEHQLMENAGRKSAEFIMENIADPFRKQILIIAGKGNNGGDGIVIHFHLCRYGVDSTLLLLAKEQTDRDLFKRYQINLDTVDIYDGELILDKFDLVVDALFGIGLTRDVRGMYRELIQLMNRHDHVIAVDMPSGILTDSGREAGVAVQADYTLTMGFAKYGHFLNDGLKNSGELHVLDIGFQALSPEDVQVTAISTKEIEDILRPFSVDTHKYKRGKVLSMCGSPGMTGAAILSIQAAYRSGCGMVRALVPNALNPIFETRLVETITLPVLDDPPGHWCSAHAGIISKLIPDHEALICGPGLGNQENIPHLVAEVLHASQNIAVVLDASGFTALTEKVIRFDQLPRDIVLTPHQGEYARLFDCTVDELQEDPIAHLQSQQRRLQGRVLVLKGAPTLILLSSGKIRLLDQGNPLLATAGTGDILAGLIGGFLAQGYSPDDAAVLGVYFHGEAAQLFLDIYGTRGMIASDLLQLLPEVFPGVGNDAY